MLIIFDLDDTLIDTFGCSQPVKFRIALEKMIAADLKVDSFEAAFQLLMNINSTASNGKETLHKFLQQYPTSEKIFQTGLDAYYGGEQLDFPINTLPGAQELLAQVQQQGHQLVLVTAGVEEEQYGKMKKAKIHPHLFHKVVLTDEYDKKKKYKSLQEEFSCQPENILVCGDKFKTDLLPAKELGMKTVHVRWGRGKIDAPFPGEVDYSIASLQELKEIIDHYDHKTNRSGDSRRGRRETPPTFNV